MTGRPGIRTAAGRIATARTSKDHGVRDEWKVAILQRPLRKVGPIDRVRRATHNEEQRVREGRSPRPATDPHGRYFGVQGYNPIIVQYEDARKPVELQAARACL